MPKTHTIPTAEDANNPGQASPEPGRDTDDTLDVADLPPLDGDPGEAPPADVDDDLVEAAESGHGLLDDETGEDDPYDVADLAVSEERVGAEDAESAEDVDIGPGALVGFPGDEEGLDGTSPASLERGRDQDGTSPASPERGRDQDPTSPDALDDDAAFRDDGWGEDAGEDGPIGDEDDVSESKLPDLDADDEGVPDDAPAGLPFEDDPSGLPWAAEPWTRVGAPWPVLDAVALCCSGTGAVVVGRVEGGAALQLLRLDLEGACQGAASSGLDPSRIRSLTAEAGTILARTQEGSLFVSSDGGATFVGADVQASRPADAARPSPASLADASGVPSGPLAVRGGLIACGARKGGVVVRGGNREPWSTVAWEGKVTALAFVDDAGTVAAATYSPADDTTALIRVAPSGEALLVGRIGPARQSGDCDGRVVAMAYDDARGVLWVAGGFGVAAFAEQRGAVTAFLAEGGGKR